MSMLLLYPVEGVSKGFHEFLTFSLLKKIVSQVFKSSFLEHYKLVLQNKL
jgi:hypothetical protein